MREKTHVLICIVIICVGLLFTLSCSRRMNLKDIAARAEETKIDSPEAKKTYEAIVGEIVVIEKLSEVGAILDALHFNERAYLSKKDTDLRFLVADVVAVRATQILTERYLKDPPSDVEGVKLIRSTFLSHPILIRTVVEILVGNKAVEELEQRGETQKAKNLIKFFLHCEVAYEAIIKSKFAEEDKSPDTQRVGV